MSQSFCHLSWRNWLELPPNLMTLSLATTGEDGRVLQKFTYCQPWKTSHTSSSSSHLTSRSCNPETPFWKTQLPRPAPPATDLRISHSPTAHRWAFRPTATVFRCLGLPCSICLGTGDGLVLRHRWVMRSLGNLWIMSTYSNMWHLFLPTDTFFSGVG